MSDSPRFRVMASDGLMSYDTFVIPVAQPQGIKDGCILMVNESTGQTVTVHETRVIPLDEPQPRGSQRARHSVCMGCGKVWGVVEDEVHCPHYGGCCSMVQVTPRAPVGQLQHAGS